jgi:hypothetical protein
MNDAILTFLTNTPETSYTARTIAASIGEESIANVARALRKLSDRKAGGKPPVKYLGSGHEEFSGCYRAAK